MDIKSAIIMAIGVVLVAAMLPTAITNIMAADSTPFSTSDPTAVDITSKQVTLLDNYLLVNGDDVETAIYKATIDLTATDIAPYDYDLMINLTEQDGTFIATINSTTDTTTDLAVSEEIEAHLEPTGIYDITAATLNVLNCTVTSDYSLEGEVYWGSAVRSMWILAPLLAIIGIVVALLSRAMKEF